MSTVLAPQDQCAPLTVNHGVSLEADRIIERLREIAEAYHASTTNQEESPSRKFYRLLNQWKRDIRFISSITEIATHPAYQQIIGMGENALPFLFKELSVNPNYYFWALEAITGIDPVPLEQKGSFDAMTAAWLQWFRQNRVIIQQ